MAEAFAAVGGVVGTPTMVLYRDPPVGFLGPVVAAPPTGADALRLWDALVALAAVPGVLELSRPARNVRRSRGCACRSRNGVSRTPAQVALPNAEPVPRSSALKRPQLVNQLSALTAVRLMPSGLCPGEPVNEP
jgi:hypothetical protein